MASIAFTTNDWSSSIRDENGHPVIGGSGHYRMAIPATALAAAGHRTALGTLMGRQNSSELGVRRPNGEVEFGYDVVVVQRWMHQMGREVLGAARANGQVIVQDVDDWWLGLDPGNFAFAATSKSADPYINREIYRSVLAVSDVITCSTPFLTDRMRKIAPTRLIRNRIDLERWNLTPESLRSPCEAARGSVTVGWVGVTSGRSTGDLEGLRGVLGPFLDRHDGWTYHGGYRWGDPTFPERAGTNPLRSYTAPMTTVDDYPFLFRGFDIGIVPLADKPFNHAKSFVKGLEYAAAGLPFVAAATPEYEHLSEEHGIGRVARRPRDWIRHLEALAGMGPEGRTLEGKAAAVKVSGWDAPTLSAEWTSLLVDLGVRV